MPNGMTPAIAYVAEGKLYTQRPGEAAKLVDSAFVQTILDRVERNRQRNEWKTEGMAWQVTQAAAAQRGMFGMTGLPAEVRRIRFSGVTAGAGGKDLLYAIDTDYVGGLFHFDLTDGYERRLYHRNQFRASDLAHHPKDGTLAFTVQLPDGTSHIATMNAEGRGFKEVTEGDAVDEAPSWAGGDGRVIVFQSAGVGRNQQGVRTGLSTYAIQRLDLDNNKMDMLVEEDASDALSPRMTADGALYFIRRPYEPFGQAISPWKVGLDILLFPLRVARAIAHFLNFFSLMFSRKPLMTAGGPPKEGPDQRFVMLWGRVVDAEKALRENTDKRGGGAALVPASWQLVRRAPDGVEQVLAKHVLAYDLCPDGGVVYTNGVKVMQLLPGGETKEIGEGKLIERVAVIR
jgi:hypothetical protein